MRLARDIVGVLLLLFGGAGCSSPPEVEGRLASQLTSKEIYEAAGRVLDQGDPELAAELSEYLLRTDFEFQPLEEVRFLAAEARFQTMEYRRALTHYRRLIDENPFSDHSELVSRRLWTIGKELLTTRSFWIDDYGSAYDTGIEALSFLVTQFPDSQQADDAWKELALSFDRDDEVLAAVDVFERIAREFPESEWTDLSLFRVALAYRRQSRGSAYDVNPLLNAHAAIRRYLERYPEGNFVEEAHRERRELEQEITVRELLLAQFYRERGVEEGVRLHLVNAATRFPAAPAARAARDRLEQVAPDALAGARGPGSSSIDRLVPRDDRPIWDRLPAAAADPDENEDEGN